MESKLIYNIADEETYKDGQTIYKEGSPGDWIYVIITGKVAITRSFQGKKSTVEVLENGEIFGELEFISGSKRMTSASAIGEVTLGIMDRQFLEKEYNQLSGQFRSILTALALRYQRMLYENPDFNRRIEPRVNQSLLLEFKDRNSFLKAYTSNISTGGLFIETAKPLKPGSQLPIKLQLPGLSERLRIKCEVMWARKKKDDDSNRLPGMGVKFIEISKKDLKILRHFLSTIGSKAHQ